RCRSWHFWYKALGSRRPAPGLKPEVRSLESLYLLDYVRRGVALGERDADHAAAAGFNGFAPDDPTRRPVGALGKHVGLQPGDDTPGIVFVEQDHRIHAAECRQNLGALVLGSDRSGTPLDRFDGPIGVHANNQRVT